MTHSTQMNEIIEERYQFCIWLYRIKKETDKRSKEKRKRGETNLVYIDIFAIPSHIKLLFGGFLKTPQYTHITTLRGHTEFVRCLILHENTLYSGSDDRTIRVWGGIGTHTETYEEIATLEGHNSWVLCLTLHENKLYSGSGDGSIRIWNIETYETIATLRGHTNWVTCLTLHENKLYSGSRDNTIQVWNTETYEEIETLRGYNSWVFYLTRYENKLVSGVISGSRDRTICIWNTKENHKLIATLRRNIEKMICLTLHENKMYAGCGDKTIRIWNADTHKLIANLEHSAAGVCCIAVHENTLVSGGEETIRVWKV